MSIKNKLLILFISLSCIPLIFLTLLIFSNANTVIRDLIIVERELRIRDEVDEINNKISTYRLQPLFLSDLPVAKSLIQTRESEEGILNESFSKQWHEQFQMIFKSMMQRDHSIDQIRYLDQSGKESIRVNRLGKDLEIVPTDKLQDKSKEHYFQRAMKLPKDVVFVSDLELNREKGVIETPHKAVMRFLVAVFNESDNREGVIVINVLMRSLLASIQKSTLGDILLINQDGTVLMTRKSNEDFILEVGKGKNYFEEHPELIENSKKFDFKNHHDIDDKQYRIWKKIFYDPNDTSRYWILFSIIPEQAFFEVASELKNAFIVISSSIAFFVMLVAFSTAKSISNPIQKLQKKIEKIGRGDSNEVTDLKTKDELGSLSRAFDKTVMLQRKAESKLTDLNHNLKLRVQEQSEKLVQTEKLSALGTMAAGVAHELNNPMMGILNYVQYCLKHTSENEKIYSVLQDAEHESRRCNRIVQDILTFSRDGRSPGEEYPKNDIKVTFDRVLKAVGDSLRSQNIKVLQQIPENTPEVPMDADKVEQVFLNLIGNAADSLAESDRKEIKIEVESKEGFLSIRISDTGGGMPKDVQSRVFDPFFTTKPPGKGTGLGLSICRSIIKEHGGELTFQSHLNQGTEFIVLLPLQN